MKIGCHNIKLQTRKGVMATGPWGGEREKNTNQLLEEKIKNLV